MKRIIIDGIKIFAIFITIVAIIFTSIYLFLVPAIVSNNNFVKGLESYVNKTAGINLSIESPRLSTGKSIAFTVKEISIDKDNKNILKLVNIDTLFDLTEIFQSKIVVKKMVADEIFVDVDDLISVLPKQERTKEKKASPIFFDFYNVLLWVKKSSIVYSAPSFYLDFSARSMIFDRTQKRKYLHFDFDFALKRDGYNIKVSANDANRFYMENGMAYIVNFPIEIVNSKIFINAKMDRKKNYDFKISAQNFSAKDVADIVKSNIFITNGRQMLEPITNVNGFVNFSLRIVNGKTAANININSVKFNVIPIMDLPVKITQGFVDIGNNDIKFRDFEGFYNNKTENSLKLSGETKDYRKTCDTKLVSDVFVTNDFFKNYLSKMIGTKIELVGNADSRLILKSKNGSLDILWFFLLKEKEGFLFDGQSMVLNDYKTLFKADLSVIKNILKINTINYYIANELKRGMRPIITMNGNIDMADNMKYLDLNLNIPRPLPSEFLNFIIGQKIFKKGYVSGQMIVDNHGSYPVMDGEFKLDRVLIPAQRMYLKAANLTAKGDLINISSQGRFRKANYDFNGKVVNNLTLPVIVKDINLTVDSIDVAKILEKPVYSYDRESAQNPQSALISTGVANEEELEAPEFTKGLLVIEKANFNLKQGVYKDIKFGNLKADMSLDKDGILKLHSNRFDIADGYSTLKVNADLVNRNYYLRLGIKNVDSNIMASAILGLPRQIYGKAKGLIELNTDKTLKLNGQMKFNISNGSIEQVGYVEYILKVASLFRNPLAMISPSTVVDLVNIPEGKFDVIQGEMQLKDNVISRMKIESTASELATLIFGRYDLTNNDASLRIYTKFSDKGKGFAGALRNLSLNALASKISISSRNDSNYYANELEMIPKLQFGEERAQVFLTKVDGDVISYNFLSSLKRIK